MNTRRYILFLPYLFVLCTNKYNSVVVSLSFDYNFSAPGVLAGANLTYIGNASSLGDRISLTNDSSTWSSGIVASRRPLRLWDNSTTNQLQIASFTTNFSIDINPIGNDNQGDGMAFFILPYPASMPADSRGGFLALITNNGRNTAFGVEFDTFENTWDPKNVGPHVGIDVNNISSTAYVPAPAPGGLRGTISASVRYDAASSKLDVAVRFEDAGVTSHVPTASVHFIELGFPQEVAVGFSAATGDYIEQHQVLSWSFDSSLSSISKRATDSTSLKRPKRVQIIAGVALAVATFLVLCLASFLCYLKYSRPKCPPNSQEEKEHIDCDELMDGEFEKGSGPRRFSYNVLSDATCGFSNDNKLGEGGFGSVYRGFLQDQRLHVAIKRVSKTSRQGRREYISEVTVISQLRHRNLVQLVGWCHDADELLLVYELMANGSLDTHLYNSTNVLSWPIRYTAILSMGSALLYLHQECEKCVLHRDIKPSNLMLDSAFNAKLGDFGLARLIDHSRRQRTTGLAGTFGYMDPECAMSSRASTESDVYSFGIVLLEITCGRQPICSEEDESKVRLVDWVWKLYGSDSLLSAADPRLKDEFDVEQMQCAMVVGLWCVHPDCGLRPSIRQAMNVLQFEAPLPILPHEMPMAWYYGHQSSGGYRSATTSSTGSSGEGSTSGPSARSHNHQTRSFGRADMTCASTAVTSTKDELEPSLSLNAIF